MKKIKFYPKDEFSELLDEKPCPTKSKVPNWYRNIDRYLNKNKIPLAPNGQTSLTVKACVPFLDTITHGYTISLPFDVYAVNPDEYGYRLIWNTSQYSVIESHSFNQISPDILPDGYEKNPFKWINPWIIKTPRDYSVLILHPMQRSELPFLTLSGIVDSDSYNLPINFPFLLKKDFYGLIKKGTPIAQIVPIKRESWTHEIGTFNEIKNEANSSNVKYQAMLENAYKKIWWNKKDFD